MKILCKHVTGSYINQKGERVNANNLYALNVDNLNNADEIMKTVYSTRGIAIDKFDDVVVPKRKKIKSKNQNKKSTSTDSVEADNIPSQEQQDKEFENILNDNDKPDFRGNATSVRFGIPFGTSQPARVSQHAESEDDFF